MNKNLQQIERDITQTIVANNVDATAYGLFGSLRGFITAVSLKIRDLWREILIARRDLFIDTCSGIKLDNYIAQLGVPERGGAIKAGTIGLITGPTGTLIPANTKFTSDITGIGYLVKEAVTLGSTNPSFVVSGQTRNKTANIGDTVWLECEVSGEMGNAPANSITVSPIANVSVTNPTPAIGGAEIESDPELRYRAKNYIKTLNKGTQRKFESLAKDLNSKVLRVFSEKDRSQPSGVFLNIVTKNAVPLTTAEKSALSSGIYAQQEAFTDIISRDISFTLISIEYRVKLKSENGVPIDGGKHYIDTADALARYFDWSKWAWGGKVSIDNVFVICDQIPQTDDIELTSFKLNGSSKTEVLIPYNSLPYFQSLKIIDTSAPTPVTRQNTNITQNYSQQQNQQLR